MSDNSSATVCRTAAIDPEAEIHRLSPEVGCARCEESATVLHALVRKRDPALRLGDNALYQRRTAAITIMVGKGFREVRHTGGIVTFRVSRDTEDRVGYW